MSWLPMYVVILNWNLYADTVACIESVLAARIDGVNILVVDNGSEDGSPELLARRFGSEVEIIRNERNEGYAVGNNIGIHHALSNGGRSILILNNDTVIDRAMIHVLLEASKAHPDIHIWGPAIFYADLPEKVWRLGDRFLSWIPLPRAVSVGAMCDPLIPVDFLTGCAMLVPGEVFDTIGLFDPRYRFYFEDAEFCERARAAGFRLACVSGARMWHKVSRSANKVSHQSRYHQSRGRVMFYRTLRSRTGKAAVYAYLACKTCAVVMRDLIKGRLDLVRASISGAHDGWQ